MASKVPLILATYLHGCVTNIECSADSLLDLQNQTRKIFSLPENQIFEEGFWLQYFHQGKWTELSSFDQLSEGTRIRLMEKGTESVVRIAGEIKEPLQYLSIHIGNGTVDGKIKGTPNLYLMISMKKAKENIRYRTLFKKQPSWNENFVVSIPDECFKDGKIAESLLIQCYNDPKNIEDLGKKVGFIEIPLQNLKKGEPYRLPSNLPNSKNLGLEAEVRWFEENRSFQYIAKKEFNGMRGCVCVSPRCYLPPPIDAFGKCKKRVEQTWFDELGLMTIDQLKKGDVLLQKSFDKKDPVVVAQRRFTASHGTKWTSHALIVCDDKHLQIAEACESRDRVSLAPRFPEGDFLVFRPTDQDYAQKAADWAHEIATKHDIHYSIAGLSSSVLSIAYDDAAKLRAKFLAEMKNLPKVMMAAQFVTAAYQSKVEGAYIELNSLFISPMKLEDLLNKNYSSWMFQGKITHSATVGYNMQHGDFTQATPRTLNKAIQKGSPEQSSSSQDSSSTEESSETPVESPKQDSKPETPLSVSVSDSPKPEHLAKTYSSPRSKDSFPVPTKAKSSPAATGKPKIEMKLTPPDHKDKAQDKQPTPKAERSSESKPEKEPTPRNSRAETPSKAKSKPGKTDKKTGKPSRSTKTTEDTSKSKQPEKKEDVVEEFDPSKHAIFI